MVSKKNNPLFRKIRRKDKNGKLRTVYVKKASAKRKTRKTRKTPELNIFQQMGLQSVPKTRKRKTKTKPHVNPDFAKLLNKEERKTTPHVNPEFAKLLKDDIPTAPTAPISIKKSNAYIPKNKETTAQKLKRFAEEDGRMIEVYRNVEDPKKKEALKKIFDKIEEKRQKELKGTYSYTRRTWNWFYNNVLD